MDSKNAKYNNEELHFIKGSHEKCEGCIFAESDIAFDGKLIIKGSDKAICKKYPNQKPVEILNSKEDCIYKKMK